MSQRLIQVEKNGSSVKVAVLCASNNLAESSTDLIYFCQMSFIIPMCNSLQTIKILRVLE